MLFDQKPLYHFDETKKREKTENASFKPYREPHLLDLGDLRSLTLGASPGFIDDSGFPVNTQPPTG
jgi:hypothetical protein